MLSPAWVFAVPATFAGALSLAIWAIAAAAAIYDSGSGSQIGNYWVIRSGVMLGLCHIAGLFAAATRLYGHRH